VTTSVSWSQALAWRLRRHGLDPVGVPAVEDIVRRLCGVQAQVPSSAEQAIRVRSTAVAAGDVDAALADGRLIRTWAMRGTLHLLEPESGAAVLAVIASGRSWERASWVRYFGMTPDEMELLRGAARDVLSDGAPRTREELVAAITPRPGLGHVAEQLRSGWGTLLKPLAWQGDLCFGPSRGQRVTFTSPSAASPSWRGLPPLEEAAPSAIRGYLAAYGPATPDQFSSWLAGGWFGKKQLHAWFRELGDHVAEVDIDGERRFVLAADVDELTATPPSDAVRLLPGFDQWVLGPGTGDEAIVATARRRDVSRTSGWIAPIVVWRGVVAGTWEARGGEARVSWWPESGRIPRRALEAEVGRWEAIAGRELRLMLGD
jgi:hypothetical protein